jgi:ribonuclease P protein component
MTLPEADVTEGFPGVTDAPPAAFVCAVETLKARADFLRTAGARRQGTGGFMLQARARGDDRAVVRVGYTASRKIGNAVTRNRAKRRLRAVVQAVLPGAARPGWDYVLVARPGATVERDFAALIDDLRGALVRVHGGRA